MDRLPMPRVLFLASLVPSDAEEGVVEVIRVLHEVGCRPRGSQSNALT